MDPSSFPKAYGGELEWQWGDMPNLDEAAHERLQPLEQPVAEGKTKKDILKGPMLFKGDQIEVLGTEDGKPRKTVIPVPQHEQVSATVATGTQTTETAKPIDAIATDNEKTGLDNVAVDVNQVSTGDNQPTVAA